MSTQAIESSPQRPRIEKAKRKKDMSHLLHYILTNVSHNTDYYQELLKRHNSITL